MKGLARSLLVVLAVAAIPRPAATQSPAEWTEPMEPVRIADELYYVGSAGLSAFLLTSEEGHVLIDAPMAENTPLVLRNIRSLGFDPRDVRVHLVTHAHFDHVGGLRSLVTETGGEVLVSEGDAPFVRAGRDFGFDSDGYPPAAVTRTLGHLDTVRLGDVELTAHVTAGHTPGCTSWSGTVHVDGEPRRFVLVCSLSALRVYRLGGEDPTYEGQADDFCRSVAYLRGLEADILLANHGQFFDLESKARALRAGDRSAFVDPEELGRFLDGAEAGIDRARANQGLAACGAEGGR